MNTGLVYSLSMDTTSHAQPLVNRYLDLPFRSDRTRSQMASGLRRAVGILGTPPTKEGCLSLGRWLLSEGSDMRDAGRHSVGSAARRYLEWQISEGLLPWKVEQVRQWVPLPRVSDTRSYRPLEEKELARLFEAASSGEDRLLLVLLGLLGLRRAEALGLDIEDFQGGLIQIRRAKGGKARSVPFVVEAAKALRICLFSRRVKAGPVFVGPSGKRLSSKALYNRFKKLAKKAAVDCCLHDLRHTFAIRCLESGDVHIAQLKTLMGHADLRTTGRYLDHVDMKRMAEKLPGSPGQEKERVAR